MEKNRAAVVVVAAFFVLIVALVDVVGVVVQHRTIFGFQKADAMIETIIIKNLFIEENDQGRRGRQRLTFRFTVCLFPLFFLSSQKERRTLILCPSTKNNCGVITCSWHKVADSLGFTKRSFSPSGTL